MVSMAVAANNKAAALAVAFLVVFWLSATTVVTELRATVAARDATISAMATQLARLETDLAEAREALERSETLRREGGIEDEDEVCRAHSAVSERLFHPHKTRERSKRRGAYSRMRAWRQYDDEHAEDIHAGHPIRIA